MNKWLCRISCVMIDCSAISRSSPKYNFWLNEVHLPRHPNSNHGVCSPLSPMNNHSGPSSKYKSNEPDSFMSYMKWPMNMQTLFPVSLMNGHFKTNLKGSQAEFLPSVSPPNCLPLQEIHSVKLHYLNNSVSWETWTVNVKTPSPIPLINGHFKTIFWLEIYWFQELSVLRDMNNEHAVSSTVLPMNGHF